MKNESYAEAKVIPLSRHETARSTVRRKSGVNSARQGSVRRINGKVYVDFIYLGERVREDSGLPWTAENAKQVRADLDKIVAKIEDGSFRFAQAFPQSRRRELFKQKENVLQGRKRTPDGILFIDFVWDWYDLLKGSGRVTGRTLLGYKSHLNLYLIPFFGEMAFGSMNARTFERYIAWGRTQKYKGKVISNKTVNKTLTLLKAITRDAAVEFKWGITYNPFFGFKKLKERDSYEDISPFSLAEQDSLIQALPHHWKPYFRFAFASGLRQGEQTGLKLDDIDWENRVLRIRRAMTFDDEGTRIEGRTKNDYSRRTIKLLPVMLEALQDQLKIQQRFTSEYFFCTTAGELIDPFKLRRDVWIPALTKANVKFREMKQTRHTFATTALTSGESPLWIAKVMGHRDTEMIIKVYMKHVEEMGVQRDGSSFNSLYQVREGEGGNRI